MSVNSSAVSFVPRYRRIRLARSLGQIVKNAPRLYLVAYEAVAEPVAVDLENSIVLREATRPDDERDGWGAEEMAEDAVVGLAPVLIDLVEQLSECSHRCLRVVHQPLSHEKI